MGNDLVPAPDPSAQSLQTAVAAAAEFIVAAQAENTRRAYAADWANFAAWCATHGLSDNPAQPGTVAAYLAAQAAKGLRLTTIRRRVAAIGDRHRASGHPDPAAHPGVRAAVKGIARAIGSAPEKKQALTADGLATVLKKIPRDLRGLRDRALILLGFAAALRRSELVGLDVCDIGRHAQGITVTVRRSKTDQLGAGMVKAVPHGRKLKPVAALDAWLAASGIASSDGPLFRSVHGCAVSRYRLSDRQVARIIKQHVGRVGLDPALFAGHSLRSGYITSASDDGASLQSIADQAGHAKLDTTRGYVQVADAFRNHSGKGFL